MTGRDPGFFLFQSFAIHSTSLALALALSPLHGVHVAMCGRCCLEGGTFLGAPEAQCVRLYYCVIVSAVLV